MDSDTLHSIRYGGLYPCFRASGAWLPGASPTDIATLEATTKRVFISRVWMSATQAENAILVFTAQRRATKTTGGTPVAPTVTKHDTQSPNATATGYKYTGAPVAGASGGTIRETPILFSGGGSAAGVVAWEFIPSSPRGIVLNPGEQVALSIGNLSNTATVYLTVEWYEEFTD